MVDVNPCSWKQDGISISTNRGIFTSLSWSPSGNYIAIATQDEGVWLLDMSNYVFKCITDIVSDSPNWWHRPTWGESDDEIFLGSTEGIYHLMRSNNEWYEKARLFKDQNILWKERVD